MNTQEALASPFQSRPTAEFRSAITYLDTTRPWGREFIMNERYEFV
jgi:hypothetical protein